MAPSLLNEFSNLAGYVARGEARSSYRRATIDHLAAFVDSEPAVA